MRLSCKQFLQLRGLLAVVSALTFGTAVREFLRSSSNRSLNLSTVLRSARTRLVLASGWRSRNAPSAFTMALSRRVIASDVLSLFLTALPSPQ